MDLHLSGKVAVVTGSSTGIGLAIAEGLAQEGVRVIVNGRRNDKVNEACDLIGDAAVPCVADVATVDGCKKLIKSAEAAGGANILINNAGTGSNETIMEASDEKWRAYMDLHLMAAVRLSRGLVPQMEKKGGGVILNNASICAVQPLWYEPIYNVSKAALMMFSKTLSLEMISKNVRVNCVSPGLVLTPDWEKTARELTAENGGDWQGYLQEVAEEHAPIKRFARTEELADFFLFLCSDRASYSVGATYFVDGGMKVTV